MPYTTKSSTINKMDCQINAIIILHSCPRPYITAAIDLPT